MKFDSTTISDAKRAEWTEVERDCAMNSAPVGEPAMCGSEKLLWFVGSDLHVDGYVFATCYDMPLDSDQHAIVAAVRKLYGDVKIVFEAELI